MLGVHFAIGLREGTFNEQLRGLHHISEKFHCPMVSYGTKEAQNRDEGGLFVFERTNHPCIQTLQKYFLNYPDDEYYRTKQCVHFEGISLEHVEKLVKLRYLIEEFDEEYYKDAIYRVNWAEV